MLARSKNLKSLKWYFSALVLAIALMTTLSARDAFADVSLTVQFPYTPEQKASNIPYSSGMSALDALTVVQSSIPLQPSGVQFSPLYQIFSIKGVAKPFLYSVNDVAGTRLGNDGIYWQFTVNGTPATVGLADYVLKDGDVVGLIYAGY